MMNDHHRSLDIPRDGMIMQPPYWPGLNTTQQSVSSTVQHSYLAALGDIIDRDAPFSRPLNEFMKEFIFMRPSMPENPKAIIGEIIWVEST